MEQAKETGKRSTRRTFLRFLSAGLPALAAGGALARGALAAAGKERSVEFPGNPSAWRSKFLTEARSERGIGAAAEMVEAPVRPSTLPLAAEPADYLPPAAPATARLSAQTSDLVRMQDELRRAMEKPIDQRKWTMVIDLQKCIGCSACTVACKAENRLPPGVVYRPVIEEEFGEYPNVTRRWLPRPCMQCENPPCVPVCPVNATWKREDGIVVIDYNACIGCRYCVVACPYSARYFDYGEHYTHDTPQHQPYEETAAPEYSRSWSRDSLEGVVRKCQFCIHRLNAGMLPACVSTCIGGATYFGDANDPESLVNELTYGRRGVMRLKEDLGTDPKVYYLV
jgi:molybdopterin-containing oxidoreductase family iron-sulfur binding subunit